MAPFGPMPSETFMQYTTIGKKSQVIALPAAGVSCRSLRLEYQGALPRVAQIVAFRRLSVRAAFQPQDAESQARVVEILDGGAARVMKTAAFKGNRRIGTASIWPQGYAGSSLFRELVQNRDGTLGSKFVPEMIPRGGEPLAPRCQALDAGACGDGRSVRLAAPDGRSAAELSPLPWNARIRLRLNGRAAAMALHLRSSAADPRGHEVCVQPAEKCVSVSGATGLTAVEGLDRPFTLEIVLKDHILDLCVNQQRTLVNWVTGASGDRLVLAVEKGRVLCDQLEITSLHD